MRERRRATVPDDTRPEDTPADLEPLLFACLLGDVDERTLAALEVLTPDEWTALVELADTYSAAPLLRRRLRSPQLAPHVPADVGRSLQAAQRSVALRNMRLLSAFQEAVAALTAADIPVLAMKGVHLAPLVYQDLAARAIGDIDLLVPAAELSRAGDALRTAGFHSLRPYQVSQGPTPYSARHLPTFFKDGAPALELHWHLVTPDSRPAVDMDSVWARAVPARIADVDVRVLSPEDLVLHLAIHAMHEHLGGRSVRSSWDLREAIQRAGDGLAWQDIVARATAWRCRRATYLALRLAHDLAGAAVPPQVLAALEPDGFDKSLLIAAMKQRPHEPMTATVGVVLAGGGVSAKLRAICRRLFLPRNQLADLYGVRRTSPLVFLWYAVRLKDLVTRYGSTIMRGAASDPALADRARGTRALDEFLSGE